MTASPSAPAAMPSEERFPVLRDKLELWRQQSVEGNMGLRDYHRRAVLELEALLAAEAALAAAVQALEPFADEKNGVMQDLLWGDQPDTATGTITTRLGHIRKAREVVRAAAGGVR